MPRIGVVKAAFVMAVPLAKVAGKSPAAIARYAGKPVACANKACVAVALVAAVTTTVPVRLGRSMVLLLVAAFPRKIVRVPVTPNSMLPVPMVEMLPPPTLVLMLPPPTLVSMLPPDEFVDMLPPLV